MVRDCCHPCPEVSDEDKIHMLIFLRLNEQRGVQEMGLMGIDVSKAKLDFAWFREENKLKAKTFPNAITG